MKNSKDLNILVFLFLKNTISTIIMIAATPIKNGKIQKIF
jgi:hypothetical protein